MSGIQFQAERLRLEDPFVHHSKVLAHSQRKISLEQDVVLQINARGDLNNSQSFRLKTQHASFSDVQYPLFKLLRSAAAEGHMLDFRHKFSIFTFFGNLQLVVLNPQVKASGGEVPAEKDRARRGRDVDESPTSGRYVRPESQSGDVDVPILVDLEERETATVEAGSLKKGELVR